MSKANQVYEWPQEDQPWFKAENQGFDSLSNSELITILIGAGSIEKNAMDLSRSILQEGKNNLFELSRLSVVELMKVSGLTKLKALKLKAAFELGKRKHASDALNKIAITSSRDLAEYLGSRFADLQY